MFTNPKQPSLLNHDTVDSFEVYVAIRESPLGDYVDLQTVSRTPEETKKVAIEADRNRPAGFVENYKPKAIRKMRLSRCS